MFLWHEGMSGRGGNEIASCLFNALTSPAHNNITSKRILTVWSDNCIGQNKNKIMLFLWIYLTVAGKYNEINHTFLIVTIKLLTILVIMMLLKKKTTLI